MEKQVRLGKSDLLVTPIGMGANAIGGHNIYPNLSDEVGKETVRTALNLGVNFIDTAFYYGLGHSEELIGEVLKERSRQDAVIATKAAHKLVDGKMTFDNSPAFLTQAVEESLKRLQTDYIDLFYIHFPDEGTPKAEAVGALQRLREQGKIRAIGVSNFSVEQMQDANADGYVDVLQSEYNLFKRAVEKDLLPFCAENGISFVPYFPLASGLLGGRYNKDSVFTDNRAKSPMFQGELFAQNVAKVDQLRPIAEAKNTEVAHVVLAWYLKQPAIDALIPGAKRPEQVEENLKTLNVELSDAETAQISAIFNH